MCKAATLAAVQGHFEVINWGASEDALPFIAAECAWNDVAAGRVYYGPDGYRAFWRYWRVAFPDWWAEVRTLNVAETAATCEYTFRGTHRGPLLFVSELLPPTGLEVTLDICEVYEVSGGRIVAARTYFDRAGLLQQLHLAVMPAGTAYGGCRPPKTLATVYRN